MRNAMQNHKKLEIRNGAALAMALVAGGVFGTVRADLPGMPPAQPPATEPSAARPSEPKAAVVIPTAPLRGSLFKQSANAVPVVIAGAEGEAQTAPVSFIAVEEAKPHRYKKNDIVTVVVREDSDSQTTGQGSSKKTQDFDVALQQFIQLALSSSGVPTVGTVNNPSSLPEIKFKYNNDRQSDAQQQRSDSLSARISATVVDVKPNGTMVIEAVKQIIVDKEEQTFKLTGVCRVQDIAVDNTVLSTQLANLMLSKKTSGEVRNGTKSGWLNQLIDKVSPF
jgi:flagellar L-ring protein precursor FlgH